MNYVFTGFRQANAVRQFAFDCVADDRSRTSVTVRADLALARKHQILLQDLPLLCRRLLEAVGENAPPASVTLTEENMIAVRAAAVKPLVFKKPPRKTKPSAAVGQAWR